MDLEINPVTYASRSRVSRPDAEVIVGGVTCQAARCLHPYPLKCMFSVMAADSKVNISFVFCQINVFF